MQLRQEEARLTEGAFGAIDAWYDKISTQIKKLASDEGQLRDAMLAASELKAAKEKKVSDDHLKWYLGQMHKTTAAQLLEDTKKLESVKGHAREEAQVREVMAQHALERAAKLALAEDQQQKSYLDSLAQSSLLIADQVAWKDKSLELEKKISQAQLEQWFIGKDLSAAKQDEYRGLLALTNQAKEYNRARERAVELGTLEGWAIERAGESLKRSRGTIKDALTGMENFVTDAWSQGIQGALTKTNKNWQEVGKTVVQSMILELNKKSFTKVWDNVAKMIAPTAKSAQGAGAAGGSPAEELSTAAGLLTTSGLQLGLSAGGLLLSGIGIATNSQALVYAGAFLQMVSLAIQVYEMFTATTTTALFTGAAAAMTVSAGALTVSAVALNSAAFALHSAAAALGGSSGGGFLGGVVKFAGGFLGFHQGGIITAHEGLNLDERLVKVQTGEGILRREAMAEYARRGISFDQLNAGRLPVAALPVPAASGDPGGNAGPRYQYHTTNVTVVTPDGKVISKHRKREIIDLLQDKDVRREARLGAR